MKRLTVEQFPNEIHGHVGSSAAAIGAFNLSDDRVSGGVKLPEMTI